MSHIVKYPGSAAFRSLLLAGFVIGTPTLAWSQEPPRPIDTSAFGEPGANCAELRYVDFASTQDAITQVTDARPLKLEDGVEYCQIEGYIWRATRFRLRFPLKDWNGKMLVQGGGGQSGDLPSDSQTARRSAPYLRVGYASVNHNGGHFSTITDTKWAYYDDSATLDFAFRSPRAATVASKAILNHFFGRAPKRSYYDGCSNGGREAMMMAQRYPWDFDGVIAGAPSIAPTDIFISMFWAADLLRDQTRAGFDMAAAKALHAGVIAQCDKKDGKADGVLDDPRQCKVDFQPLMCKSGAADDCLTQRQAEIARKMYEGPGTADGQQIARSSALPGSEISWVAFITPRWTIDYASEVFKYVAFPVPPGPGFTPDVRELAEYSKRMSGMDAVTAALNPDLRKFQSRGGKVLAYYGWTDAFGGAQSIIDYYETAERVMGGQRRLKTFFACS